MKKSVLITGVSGDIGGALAREFAKNGYNIIATFNNNKIAEDLINYCTECGVSFCQYKLDIKNATEVANVFDLAFKQSDYLDCVICNSGISIGEKMLCENSDEEIENLIQTNLVGTIYCNREAAKHLMAQRHGQIINISSIYGVNGGSCEAVYSASKAGVIGLTKALAQELEGGNIRVNAVAPGFVETNMTACFSEQEKEEYKQEHNLQRLAQPEDVAQAVYVLVQQRDDLNGEVVFVN